MHDTRVVVRGHHLVLSFCLVEAGLILLVL